MSDDRFLRYFRHFVSSHNEMKLSILIEEYGMQGYGLFWLILEIMGAAPDCKIPLEEYSLRAIKFKSKLDENYIERFLNDCVINFNLFENEDNCIFYPPLLEEYNKIKNAINMQKEAGRMGGLKSGETRRKKADLRAKKSDQTEIQFSKKKGNPDFESSTNESYPQINEGGLQNELSTGIEGGVEGSSRGLGGAFDFSEPLRYKNQRGPSNNISDDLLPHEKKRHLSTKKGSYQQAIEGPLQGSSRPPSIFQKNEKNMSYPQKIEAIREDYKTINKTKQQENTHSPNPSLTSDLVCSELLKNKKGDQASKMASGSLEISDLEFLKNFIRSKNIDSTLIPRLMDIYYFSKSTHVKNKIIDPSAWKATVIRNVGRGIDAFPNIAGECLKFLEKQKKSKHDEVKKQTEELKRVEMDTQKTHRKEMVDAVIESMSIDEKEILESEALEELMMETNRTKDNIPIMFISEKKRDIVLKRLNQKVVAQNG